jgi:hypothetical protein
MDEHTSIAVDKVYCVETHKVRFLVRTIRPLAIPGWWLCVTEDTGIVTMMPEEALAEPEPGSPPSHNPTSAPGTQAGASAGRVGESSRT